MIHRGRKLGSIETQMAAMHGAMNGTTQGTQVTALRGAVSLAALRDAAAAIFAKYALLRCAIDQVGDSLYFVEHGEFARVEVSDLRVAGAADWERFYTAEFTNVLDQTRVLWRLTLVAGPGPDEFRVVFTCHHAIIDGTGFYTVINELLDLTDRAMAGPIGRPADVGLPPAIDDYLLPPAPEPYVETTPCAPIPYARQEALRARRTRVVHHVLAADRYQVLERRCKADGINVNSLLSAVIATAACEAGIATSPVAFKTAVSLRERASARPGYVDQLGCYIGVADVAIVVDGGDIRKIATAYERKLFTYIVKNCLRRSQTDLGALLGRVEALQAAGAFGQGIGITNLGVADLRMQYAHFRVVDYEGTNNRVAGNVAFVFHVVVLAGVLKIRVVYPEPLLGDEQVARLCRSFMGRLDEYLAESPAGVREAVTPA